MFNYCFNLKKFKIKEKFKNQFKNIINNNKILFEFN